VIFEHGSPYSGLVPALARPAHLHLAQFLARVALELHSLGAFLEVDYHGVPNDLGLILDVDFLVSPNQLLNLMFSLSQSVGHKLLVVDSGLPVVVFMVEVGLEDLHFLSVV
jgi:hypothetical protein